MPLVAIKHDVPTLRDSSLGGTLSSPDLHSSGQTAGKPIAMQSKDLCVDVLPDNGGRVASIRCIRTGTEFLVGGSDYDAKAQFVNDARFEASDCAGMDECLPTVSISGPETAGGNAPDHGDLWRHSWRVEQQSANDVLLATECFSRPLSFTRRLRVQAAEVQLDYRIGNLSEMPVPFLYACHPLFAVEAGDRLILPRETDKVRLHYSRGDRVDPAVESLDWPLVADGDAKIALDRIGEASDGTAEMLYTDRLARGVCALYRARKRQALVMRFDKNVLPYLGLWLCCGGWPDNPVHQKQYAVAMEPTVAPCGSLAAAIAAGAAPILAPHGVFAFSLCLEVLGCDKPWSYDAVETYIHESSCDVVGCNEEACREFRDNSRRNLLTS